MGLCHRIHCPDVFQMLTTHRVNQGYTVVLVATPKSGVNRRALDLLGDDFTIELIDGAVEGLARDGRRASSNPIYIREA